MHSDVAEQAALRQRVLGVENGLIEIKGLIGNLAAKFETHSRTPWVVIISALGVVGTALGAYFNLELQPVNRELDRQNLIIEKLADRYMPASEIDRKFSDMATSYDKQRETSAARRDDWQRNSEQAMQRAFGGIEKLQAEVVSRGEHEEHWRGVDKQITDLQRQIDEVKREQAGLYSARDVLKDDTERLRALEAKLMALTAGEKR